MECVLYQDDLREIADMPGLLGEEKIESGSAASQNILNMDILNSADGLKIMIDYAASRYNVASMEYYGVIVNSVCKAMIELGNKNKVTVKIS